MCYCFVFSCSCSAALTYSSVSISTGSFLTIGNIAATTDWLCWRTGTAAAPTTITGVECATTGVAIAFGNAGNTVVCSGLAGGTQSKIIEWDDSNELYLSVIACSAVGIASSDAVLISFTLTEAGVCFLVLLLSILFSTSIRPSIHCFIPPSAHFLSFLALHLRACVRFLLSIFPVATTLCICSLGPLWFHSDWIGVHGDYRQHRERGLRLAVLED
jgi:hypothetical protein